MNAPEIQEEELHAFVDGQLPRDRCTAMLAYLAQHPQEIARLATYAGHKEALRRQLKAIDLPSGDATTAALQRALADRLKGSSHRSWLRRVAVVAVLLCVGWWSNTVYRLYLVDRLPDVVTEAAQAHQIFSRDTDRPVELTAAARADMEAWFSGRLGELVEIPSLKSIGMHLIGGRLLAGHEGPVAQLIYEDQSGHRFTLGLSAETRDTGREVEVVMLEDLIAGYWHEGALTYALVGRTTEQELVGIATNLGADEPQSWL